VESYSPTRLTFARDKLVAFEGVIDLVQKRTGLTSLAGLWREFVLDDILWSSADPKSASRPADYRAPSFSWASIEGKVQRKFDRFRCRIAENFFLTAHSGIPHLPQAKYLAEVVADRVEMVDPTRHTGEVKKAELVLKGFPLRYVSRKVVLDGKSIWSHPWNDDFGGNSGHLIHKWLELDVETDGASGIIDVVLLPIMAWYQEKEREGENMGDEPGSGCVETSEQSDSGPAYTNFHVAGLVLQRCGDRSITHRRIGTFEHCDWILGRKNGACRDLWTVGKTQDTLTLV
jgi:hypothetical protein